MEDAIQVLRVDFAVSMYQHKHSGFNEIPHAFDTLGVAFREILATNRNRKQLCDQYTLAVRFVE